MEEYRNFSLFIILIPTPDFPHFYCMLGGNLGSLLYGDVSVMLMFNAEEEEEAGGVVTSIDTAFTKYKMDNGPEKKHE